MLVYKILRENEFLHLESCGKTLGSPQDIRDGYIHLSKAEQVEGTLNKHFKGEKKLILIALETKFLGSSLRWEKGTTKETYPHFYGQVNFNMASWISPIEFNGEDFIVPAGLKNGKIF